MRETQFQSLGWEDSLEKRMATHSSILAWRILWTEESGLWTMVHGITKSLTQLSNYHHHYDMSVIVRTLIKINIAIELDQISFAIY